MTCPDYVDHFDDDGDEGICEHYCDDLCEDYCTHTHCFACGECCCPGYCDDYQTYNLRGHGVLADPEGAPLHPVPAPGSDPNGGEPGSKRGGILT